jgi:hypothetical protein
MSVCFRTRPTSPAARHGHVTDPARRRARIAAALLALASLPAAAQISKSGTGLLFKQQPVAARVGLGGGTEFSVDVKAEPGVSILRHEWKINGTLVPKVSGRVLRLQNLQPQQAGTVTVDVIGSRGTVTSAPVRLDVVAHTWAQLGGRAITGAVPLHRPSLQDCGGLTLAWIAGAAGRGDLRVHRFDGAAWVAVGANRLNRRPASDATDPSLQCSDLRGLADPVVAWSESTATGRTIEVSRFDGASWLGVGAPGASPGADARQPQLRVVAAEPSEGTQSDVYPTPVDHDLRRKTALAWLESGRPQVRQWSGQQWVGGTAIGQSVTDLALGVDSVMRRNGYKIHPLLLGSADHWAFGALKDRDYPAVHSNFSAQWAPVGADVSTPAARGVPVRMVGLGFDDENSRPRVVAVWVEGSASYILRSATLFSTDYESAVQRPYLRPAWQRFALDHTGSNLQAMAWDATPDQGPCSPFGPASFRLALTDYGGTKVLFTQCSNGGPEWRASHPNLPVRALALDLKMVNPQDPHVATVDAVGAGYQLSVWRYYP